MSEPSLHQLSIDVAEIKKDLRGVWRRIDEQMKLASSVHELTVKVERQGVELNNLVEKLTELVDDIRQMKEKPARRWEAAVSQIIGMVIAAVAGFLFARLGL